jgi:hypothetical protein
MYSPTVTGFTGFVLSSTTDAGGVGGGVVGVDAAAAAAGGGAVGVDGVDEGAGVIVGVEAGAVGVDGPPICDVGEGAGTWVLKPPDARQSTTWKCGRICMPYFCDFHGRFSKCTIGSTCSPRSMRITATCSSKLEKASRAP